MAISKEQRKALEDLGYKVGKSGNTVQTADGKTVGGFNENGNIFSGNPKVAAILRSKPAPEEEPKPKSRPKSKPKPAPEEPKNVGGAKAERRRLGAPPAAPKPKPFTLGRFGPLGSYKSGGSVSRGRGKTY